MSAKHGKTGKGAGRALGLTMTILAAALLAPAGPVAADAGGTDPLHEALDLAAALTARQADELGFAVAAGPAAQGFATPGEAVRALLARFDAEPSEEQARDIAALDALPAPKREALAGLIGAYLAFEEAARLAYADLDPVAAGAALDQAFAAAAAMPGAPLADGPAALAAWEREHLPTTSIAGLRDLGLDLSGVFGARARMLDATVTFAEAFGGGEAAGPGADATPPPPPNPLVMAPALILDLHGTSDVHAVDVALSIDVGGSDRYDNNAGGVARDIPGTWYDCGVDHPFAAAAAIDLAGDDRRTGPRLCGVNGGGAMGAGFSFDLAGDDTYLGPSGNGANGGSVLGAGFLLDAAGRDCYCAGSHGVNGGAFLGAGMLVDGSAGDQYFAGSHGVNGGGLGMGLHTYYHMRLTQLGLPGDRPPAGTAVGVASGILADLAGDDTYVGYSYGVNGGGYLHASGMLLDRAGDDDYWANSWGTNGGGYGGTGLLVDADGDDEYQAISVATNGGGRYGAGTLLDLRGDDVYGGAFPQHYQSNGGAESGVGLLVDVAGNDRYTAGLHGVNGRALASCDLPVLAGSLEPMGIAPLNKCYATLPALALLVDLGGADAYDDQDGGAGLDRSVVFKGILGAQLDTCLAEPPGSLALPAVPDLGQVLVGVMGAKVQACTPAVRWGGTPPIVARVPDGTFADACAAALPAPAPSSPCHGSVDLVKVLLPRQDGNRQCLPQGMPNFCLGVPVSTALPPLCQVASAACIPADTLDDRTLVSVPATPGLPVAPAATAAVEVKPGRVAVQPNLGQTETQEPSVPTPFGPIEGEVDVPKAPTVDADGGIEVTAQGQRVEVPLRL